MIQRRTVIALEHRLKACANVITLGVHTNLQDYAPEDLSLIQNASKIYYPTTFYADIFDATGKAIFPSYHTYKFVQDKIKQTALFRLLGIPHPRTRFFYGKRQKRTISHYFQFPFIAKIARGSALGRGVFLIRNQQELEDYCKIAEPAYVQEYLETDRDIRVVVIGEQIAHAYWRVAVQGQFKCNIASGAAICLDPVPTEALELALGTACECRWNDVGIDILPYKGKYLVLEANMKYGKEGFRKAGIDYIKLMEEKIENNDI